MNSDFMYHQKRLIIQNRLKFDQQIIIHYFFLSGLYFGVIFGVILGVTLSKL